MSVREIIVFGVCELVYHLQALCNILIVPDHLVRWVGCISKERGSERWWLGDTQEVQGGEMA